LRIILCYQTLGLEGRKHGPNSKEGITKLAALGNDWGMRSRKGRTVSGSGGGGKYKREYAEVGKWGGKMQMDAKTE